MTRGGRCGGWRCGPDWHGRGRELAGREVMAGYRELRKWQGFIP